jgi:hypothetical protein
MDDRTYYKLIDIYRGFKTDFDSYELLVYPYPNSLGELYKLVNAEKERRESESKRN